MKATGMGEYSAKEDCYATFNIDCEHRSETHHEQIVVYGNEELRDLVVTLLNNHFSDRPTTNAYRAIPIPYQEKTGQIEQSDTPCAYRGIPIEGDENV